MLSDSVLSIILSVLKIVVGLLQTHLDSLNALNSITKSVVPNNDVKINS